MKFSIKSEPKDLCASCTEVHRSTNRHGKTLTICQAVRSHVPLVIHEPVAECNEYEQVGKMRRHEADLIGWVLEVKKGKVVGFRPPRTDID